MKLLQQNVNVKECDSKDFGFDGKQLQRNISFFLKVFQEAGWGGNSRNMMNIMFIATVSLRNENNSSF